MYNFIKNSIYGNIRQKFVEKTYYHFEPTKGENVYIKGKTIFINNFDETVGKRLYDVLISLKKCKIRKECCISPFKVKDIICTPNNIVKCFSIKRGSVLYNWWWHVSKYERIQDFAMFVELLERNNFIINSEIFDISKCNGISEILSYLVHISDDEEEAEKQKIASRACLIEYAHYVLSEKNEPLYKTYQKLEKYGKNFVQGYKLGYGADFIKISYELYKFHTIPDDFYEIIEDIDKLVPNTDETIAYSLTEDFTLGCSITKKTKAYTIYDNSIKIYNKNTSDTYTDEFSCFVEKEASFLRSKSRECIEKFDYLIFNLNKEFIGYKIKKESKNKTLNILDFDFCNQAEILACVKQISEFISSYKCEYELRKVVNVKSLIENNYSIPQYNKTDITKSIVVIADKNESDGMDEYNLMITNIREMYNLLFVDEKKAVFKVFFALLHKHITKKYGVLRNEKEVFSKIEVRALNPLVAKSFVKYVFNQDKIDELVEKKEVINQFNELIYGYALHEDEKGNSFGYDPNFEFDPAEVAITFDTEIEERYNIKIEKGNCEILPDKRYMVIFQRAHDIHVARNKDQDIHNEIESYFENDLEDEHVKIVGYSEIIYSKQLNKNGMYKFIGYIKEPIKGTLLTNKYLATLNNKDLYKISAYLYSKFTDYYIPSGYVYVDSRFNFYIDFLYEEFDIKKCEMPQYVEAIFDNLCDEFGWNRSIFEDFEDKKSVFPEIAKSKKELKEFFLELTNNMDKYCIEHNTYYKSSDKQCPVCRKIKYIANPDTIVKTSKLVFEDEYAQHYELNENFNVKLYKPLLRCQMDRIKQNVLKMVTNSFNSLELGQDCFNPVKIVIDENNYFVGCIYQTVQFVKSEVGNEYCIDFKDFEQLDLLPRLKCLYRLIVQVQNLTNNRQVGFLFNPFTEVFLNPGHKKQVQILNIEFLQTEESRKTTDLRALTIKWLCEYVSEILNTNESIISDETCKNVVKYYCGVSTRNEESLDFYINDLQILQNNIKKLSAEMTKYCPIHRKYYSNTLLFCPECMPNTELQQQITVKDQKEKFLSKKPKDEGGESFIYYYGENLVAKVFKTENINLSLKTSTLLQILLKKDILNDINKSNQKFHYVIPEKILVDAKNGEIFGYIMEKINDVKPISSLKHKSIVEELNFQRKDILEILITIGEGIETMHKRANIYIGDLNGQNILFDSNKNVYFIDFDGMGVENISPEFCTDGYIDPISKENQNITMKDDWYSYAIQVFYYLTYTHPFNGIYYEEDSSGKKVLLEIPDKMKKRISLLGKYGIKPPTIAENWDWMDSDLKDAFLSIFEGDSRESIVPLLKKQYKTLYSKDFDS